VLGLSIAALAIDRYYWGLMPTAPISSFLLGADILTWVIFIFV
jgi:hypothetical protein